jgi:transposase
MVECAQHYALPPKVSQELSHRQLGIPREILSISWKAQNRLHLRLMRLTARRVPRNKALVAVARELCGFIWAVLRSCPCYLNSPSEVKMAA